MRRDRKVARIWAAIWLPLLLGTLAVILTPVVGGFLLGGTLVLLALVATGVADLVRIIRRADRDRCPRRRVGRPRGA